MSEAIMTKERNYLISLLVSPPANPSALSIADLHMLVLQQLQDLGPTPGQGGR